ncbi:MAG TPA: PmoA family protein [Chitinophaga sp.]
MKQWYLLLLPAMFPCCIYAQHSSVTFNPDPTQHRISVSVNGKSFCNFIYPDNLEKPVLYPIFSPGGHRITRGYPPAAGESTDHPHHVGLWLNYESVNGLDFWNNSSAIPANKKSHYGWILGVQVTGAHDSTLTYTANWENQAHHVLLKEDTRFVFRGSKNIRIIDRITTLTAQRDSVHFDDMKDGMLGLRVVKSLELPDTARSFTDAQGNVTTVAASGSGATGNYLTSTGKTGNEAWGTRGEWCMLYGEVEKEEVAVVIFDHPENPGFPTYWHARNYGLFAANPLGHKVFSNGLQTLNFSLAPGASATFRYRIIIYSGPTPGAAALNEQAEQFSSIKIHS